MPSGWFHTADNKEKSRQRSTTHNQSRTRLYRIWAGMKSRCKNKSHPSFKYYGGCGVTVCDEWQRYEAFRDWAVANGYADNLTIDRWPNRGGNYEPENCRWATSVEQNNNRKQRNK